MKQFAGDLAAIEGFLESATAHLRAIKIAPLGVATKRQCGRT